MSLFQKRLSGFLTECKNDALLELSSNRAYTEWKTKSEELFNLLKTQIPPELLEQLEQYQEAVSAVSGIESDYCYLCGIRDYLNIGRQFDVPADWNDLISHMIAGT